MALAASFALEAMSSSAVEFFAVMVMAAHNRSKITNNKKTTIK